MIKSSVDNSNTLEMTTAEHCMYLTKFCELLMVRTVLENVINIKLQRLKSARAGACITQNQKDWESFKLNHKHSHSPHVQVGLQQHLSL